MTLRDVASKLIFVVVVMAVGGLVISVPLYQQSIAIRAEMSDLKTNNDLLLEENDRLRYIQSLSVEFSMDPMVVTLVDHYSRRYLKHDSPEWRLIQNPEFMTYLMLSLIWAESKGNPSAIGDGGKARGLTQIWVSTANDYGTVSPQELLNPETNLSYSFKHFHHLLKKYKGNVALALYSWNRGAGTVDRLLLYGESPDNGFAKKVYEAAVVNNRSLVVRN
jgi:soluble lytic murein transglycosylase-like protein